MTDDSPMTKADGRRLERKMDEFMRDIRLVIWGESGNGNRPGLIRSDDRNTRFRERMTWWAKALAVGIVLPLSLAGLTAIGARIMGVF